MIGCFFCISFKTKKNSFCILKTKIRKQIKDVLENSFLFCKTHGGNFVNKGQHTLRISNHTLPIIFCFFFISLPRNFFPSLLFVFFLIFFSFTSLPHFHLNYLFKNNYSISFLFFTILKLFLKASLSNKFFYFFIFKN